MIKNITIVGAGRVGGSLAARLLEKGLNVRIVRRGDYDAWISSEEPFGDIVVLALRDHDIRQVAEELALSVSVDLDFGKDESSVAPPYSFQQPASNRLSAIDDASGNRSSAIDDASGNRSSAIDDASGNRLSNTMVIHVNGSLRLDVLEACDDVGAHVGAAHPFQTFAGVDATALDGIGWGVECADEDWPLLREFVEATGGVPHHLDVKDDEHKRVYHTSAVAASNYTYAAYELGRRLADQAGVSAKDFLLPIMDRTHSNAAQAIRDNAAMPLTGPIQRGDVAAVRLQLAAIPEHEKKVYVYLSLALLHLNKDNMQADAFRSMEALLSDTLK